MRAKSQPPFDPEHFLSRTGEGRSIGRYRKSQTIFSQGDPADALFYIQSGKVKITVLSEHGKEAVIAVLGANDFFGEACLAGRAVRVMTVTTMTESVITRLEKTAFVREMREEPAFAEIFLQQVLERTIRVEADLVDHLFNSSEKRLARLLWILATYDRASEADAIITNISQETLVH